MRIAYRLAGALAIFGAIAAVLVHETGGLATEPTGFDVQSLGSPEPRPPSAEQRAAAWAEEHRVSPSQLAARASLAKALQSELTRVACYDGAVDGHWNAATRRGMATFLEQMDISLPTGQPDEVLLTLVQSYRTVACRVVCDAGRTQADNGRCVPSPALARYPASIEAERVPRVKPGQSQPAGTVAGKPVGPGSSPSHGRDLVLAPPTAATVTPLASQPAPILPGRMTMGATIVPSQAEAVAPSETALSPLASGITTGSLPPHADGTKRQVAPARPRRNGDWTADFFSDRR